jgi:hypothetical protein
MVQPPQDFPFLFLGAGFATARKSTEGVLWFDRYPSAEEMAAVERLLPRALTHVRRWSGEFFAFGSDDALEWHVAGEQERVPTRGEWKGFCASFEQRMREVHTIVPLRLVLKDEDGSYGRTLSPWHDWSLVEMCRRLLDPSFLRAVRSVEGFPICAAVLGWLDSSKRAARGLSPEARRALVRFALEGLDALDDGPARDLIRRLCIALPSEPFTPADLDVVFRFPTDEVAARIGPEQVAQRVLGLLAAARPETSEAILTTACDWIVRVPFAAQVAIAEGLLACESLSERLAVNGAAARDSQAANEPVRVAEPSLALCASADYYLETSAPANALACLELALRFPEPWRDTYGLLVRAYHGTGQFERAEALAVSDLVQRETAPLAPRVYYDVARYYIATGQPERAFAQLQRYATCAPSKAGLLRFDPRVAPLRSFPEFEALVSPR